MQTHSSSRASLSIRNLQTVQNITCTLVLSLHMYTFITENIEALFTRKKIYNINWSLQISITFVSDFTFFLCLVLSMSFTVSGRGLLSVSGSLRLSIPPVRPRKPNTVN